MIPISLFRKEFKSFSMSSDVQVEAVSLQLTNNRQRIKWKDKVRYLGNILTKDMCDDADIRAKRVEFIGSVNRLNVQFRVVPDQIRIRLLQTYCTAWYGCQTWLLNTNHVKGMTIEWKKAVRRTLNLPRMTRSKLIPLLAGNCSFQEQHERRCGDVNFAQMTMNTVKCTSHILHQVII